MDQTLKSSAILTDKSGSVAIWFAAFIPAFLLFAAFVIDAARYHAMKSGLRTSVKSITEMLARNYYSTDLSQLENVAERILAGAISNRSFPLVLNNQIEISGLTIQYDEQRSHLQSMATVKMPTSLLGALNFQDDVIMSVGAEYKFNVPDTELVILMDGSALSGSAGVYQLFRTELSYLFNRLTSMQINGADISVAVNAHSGRYTNVSPRKDWVAIEQWPESLLPPNVPGVVTWHGPLEAQRWCIAPRDTSIDTMRLPSDVPFPLVLQIIKGTNSAGEDAYSIVENPDCPNNPIIPLSNNLSDLSQSIFNFQASGSYRPGDAMLWAKRLFDRNWQSALGAISNTSEKTKIRKKILILSAQSSIQTPDDLAKFNSLCAEFKTNGTEVTVFDMSLTITKDTNFENCTANGGGYFQIQTSDELHAYVASYVNAFVRPQLIALH